MAKNKLSAGLKEFFRKRIVALKRKPQMIPMVVLGIAFVLYSLTSPIFPIPRHASISRAWA